MPIELTIQKALAKKLNSVVSGTTLVWENQDYAPTIGTPHLRVGLYPTDSDILTLGPSPWKEYRGVLQIACFYPAGRGWGDAKTKAATLTSSLKHGTAITYGSADVLIRVERADTLPSYQDEEGAWFVVPVEIEYKCYNNG